MTLNETNYYNKYGIKQEAPLFCGHYDLREISEAKAIATARDQ